MDVLGKLRVISGGERPLGAQAMPACGESQWAFGRDVHRVGQEFLDEPARRVARETARGEFPDTSGRVWS